MTAVSNIQQLIDRRNAFDQIYVDLAATVSLAHPGHAAIHREPLKLLNPTNVICTDCGEPEFMTRNQEKGIEEERCRGCLNATRQLSLVHPTAGGNLCLRCDLSYGSLGDLLAANHWNPFPADDFDFLDRSSEVEATISKPGLVSLISAGLIEIEDGPDLVVIHESTHSASQHCVGCFQVRHPGCAGVGICDDAQ